MNSTVTDDDGNIYETVVIGNQIWMKQNLRVCKFAGGGLIPANPDSTYWMGDSFGAYSNFDGDPNMDVICGKLFNYYALEKGLLLPEGWRISTAEDWNELNVFLDATKSKSGDKLKTRWGWDKIDNDGKHVEFLPNPSINSNSSGFSALPSGIRNPEYTYDEDRRGAYFWAYPNADKNSPSATCYMLGYNYPNVDESNAYLKRCGMSVRCVKI